MWLAVAALAVGASRGGGAAVGSAAVEQWGRWEACWPGPSGASNPFDVEFFVDLTLNPDGRPNATVRGFYDGGDGHYKARFMPPEPGTWRFRTRSTAPELDAIEGTFIASPATPGSHGPVRAAPNQTKFAYADGSPFFAVARGTFLHRRTPTPISRPCDLRTSHRGPAPESLQRGRGSVLSMLHCVSRPQRSTASSSTRHQPSPPCGPRPSTR